MPFACSVSFSEVGGTSFGQSGARCSANTSLYPLKLYTAFFVRKRTRGSKIIKCAWCSYTRRCVTDSRNHLLISPPAPRHTRANVLQIVWSVYGDHVLRRSKHRVDASALAAVDKCVGTENNQTSPFWSRGSQTIALRNSSNFCRRGLVSVHRRLFSDAHACMRWK